MEGGLFTLLQYCMITGLLCQAVIGFILSGTYNLLVMVYDDVG
jgi:hypothetical protein